MKVGKEGMSALKPTTIIEEWKINLSKFGKLSALSVKRNNEWKTLTYEEYYLENIKFAKSLIALNLP